MNRQIKQKKLIMYANILLRSNSYSRFAILWWHRIVNNEKNSQHTQRWASQNFNTLLLHIDFDEWITEPIPNHKNTRWNVQCTCIHIVQPFTVLYKFIKCIRAMLTFNPFPTRCDKSIDVLQYGLHGTWITNYRYVFIQVSPLNRSRVSQTPPATGHTLPHDLSSKFRFAEWLILADRAKVPRTYEFRSILLTFIHNVTI